MNIVQTLKNEKVKQFLFRILRYVMGCGLFLLLKIVLSTAFNVIGIPFWASYLLSLVCLIFCSFFYHYFFTFQRKYEGMKEMFFSFLQFAGTFIALFALDYAIVVIGVTYAESRFLPPDISALYRQAFHGCAIVFTSGFIFILRFFLYNFLFKKQKEAGGCNQ